MTTFASSSATCDAMEFPAARPGLDVGAVVRNARARTGRSQRALAGLAGLPKSTIADWETGRVVPRVDELDRVLRLCGLRLTNELVAAKPAAPSALELYRWLRLNARFRLLEIEAVHGSCAGLATTVLQLGQQWPPVIVVGAVARALWAGADRCDRVEVLAMRPQPTSVTVVSELAGVGDYAAVARSAEGRHLQPFGRAASGGARPTGRLLVASPQQLLVAAYRDDPALLAVVGLVEERDGWDSGGRRWPAHQGPVMENATSRRATPRWPSPAPGR